MLQRISLSARGSWADRGSRSDQYLELDTEGAIGLYGTSISSRQRKLMFEGGGRHERVHTPPPLQFRFGSIDPGDLVPPVRRESATQESCG